MKKRNSKVVLCSNIDCHKVTCPNHTYTWYKTSFNYPSCLVNLEKSDAKPNMDRQVSISSSRGK